MRQVARRRIGGEDESGIWWGFGVVGEGFVPLEGRSEGVARVAPVVGGRDSIAHWGRLGWGNRERVNACVIPAGTYVLGVRVLHARKSERAGESASYISRRVSPVHIDIFVMARPHHRRARTRIYDY